MVLARFFYPFFVRFENTIICIRSWYWKALIQFYGGTVGKKFTLRRGARVSFTPSSKIVIGSNITFAESAVCYVGENAELTLEDLVFLGRFTTVAANKKVRIGTGSQIANCVTIIDSDHGFNDLNKPILKQGLHMKEILIDREVWVGANAIILKGTHLGDHCVIGAGTVVTKDVPPNMVVVGNPNQYRPVQR